MNREQTASPQFSVQFSILLGALFSVCAAVPAAIITAMFYRFPVLLVDYVSIPELLGSKGLTETARLLPGLFVGISLTVFFMCTRGWYVFLVLVGGIGGWVVHRSGAVNYRASVRWNLIVACIAGLFFALVNANLGER